MRRIHVERKTRPGGVGDSYKAGEVDPLDEKAISYVSGGGLSPNAKIFTSFQLTVIGRHNLKTVE